MSRATEPKQAAARAKRAAVPTRAVAPPARPEAALASEALAVVTAAGTAAPTDASALPALPPALDIREIRTCFELLRSAVNCGVDRIDASRVAAVDTAGLQLLLAAGRTAAAHGRTLRWAGASSALVEAATKLGIAGVLGLARTG